MSLSKNQLQNLQAAGTPAVSCSTNLKVPPEFILAQWALESGWGMNSPENNCFGIKRYAGCYGEQLLWTLEFFNDVELREFLTVLGRTALLYPAPDPRKDGRLRYRCQDWFATFKTLLDCFNFRAALFTKGVYAPITAQFQIDHDMSKFVEQTAEHYATADPNTYKVTIMSIMSMPEIQAAVQMGKLMQAAKAS